MKEKSKSENPIKKRKLTESPSAAEKSKPSLISAIEGIIRSETTTLTPQL